MKSRIGELVRIKSTRINNILTLCVWISLLTYFVSYFVDSVNNELRNIEGKRQKLLGELAFNQQKIEDAKAELVRQEAELEKLKISVKQVNVTN